MPMFTPQKDAELPIQTERAVKVCELFEAILEALDLLRTPAIVQSPVLRLVGVPGEKDSGHQ